MALNLHPMRNVVFSLFALILFVHGALAQTPSPVKWTWKAEPAGKGEYKLTFTAAIDKKWHTYSQQVAEGGPIPTSIKFDDKNTAVQLSGITTEAGPKVHDGHDVVFDMQLKYFEDEMVCTQIVKVSKDTVLKGEIEYMACDDATCLPPTIVNFTFDLKKN